MEKLKGLVILTVAIGFGLYLGWTGIQNLRQADASTDWPQVTGRVTSARVSTRQVRKGSEGTRRRYKTMYDADVRYSYAVDGVGHTGERVSFGSHGTSEPTHAQGIVARYPAGAAVAVYYDPDDPSRAVLETGRKTGSLITPIVGFLFAGLFALFFMFMRWLARKQQEMQAAGPRAEPFPRSPVDGRPPRQGVVRSSGGSRLARPIRKTVRRADLRFIATATLLGLAGAAWIYLLRSSHQTGDSLAYATAVKTGVGMFHPHHLLFVPVVRLVYLAFSSICGTCDSLFSAQIHNLVWAAAAIGSISVIACRTTGSRALGLLAGLALLFSRGFWWYSTQSEVYIPALGCLALLVAVLSSREEPGLGRSSVVAIGLLLAGSIFYHQTSVLFCVPLLFHLLARQGRYGVKTWAAITSIAGASTLLVYAVAFLARSDSWTAGDFVRYCLSYSYHPNPDWGTVLHFGPSGIASLLYSQIWNVTVVFDPFRELGVVVAALIVVGLLGWQGVQVARGARPLAARVLFLSWCATYYLFFLWWLPSQTEFFVATLLPLLGLLFLSIHDLLSRWPGPRDQKRIRIVTSLMVLALGAVNLAGFIVPLFMSPDPLKDRASRLAGQLPTECTILGDYRLNHNLGYYFDYDSVFPARAALFSFYRDQPLPPVLQRRDMDCVCVELTFLVPGNRAGDFDAYTHPAGWLRFVSWLADTDLTSEATVAEARRITVRARAVAPPFVCFGPSRTPVGSLEEVLEALDTATDAPQRPFSSWRDGSVSRPGSGS